MYTSDSMGSTAEGFLLTQEELAAIRAPIESARTLPKRAFVDPAFYRFEEEHLLRPSWLAVGFSAELDKGSCRPCTVLGVPVLLVRDRDGVGRAFHNVCPYDGCEAVLSPLSDVDEIVTPYHGWRYALDGRLLQVPYWDGTPDAASLDVAALDADLAPIDCAEWLGTVFVRLTAEGDSFDRYLQPVTDYCADLDLQRLEPGHDEHGRPRIDRLTIHANWKTVYENYSPNVYHENFVHAMYRRSPHTPRVSDGNKTYREVIGDNGFIGAGLRQPRRWLLLSRFAVPAGFRYRAGKPWPAQCNHQRVSELGGDRAQSVREDHHQPAGGGGSLRTVHRDLLRQ